MLTRFLGVILVAFGVVSSGCNSASDQGKAVGSNTRALAATLASLNLADPAADLDVHLKSGDIRFIGINGYTCTAPGVADADTDVVSRHGMRCLEGTSDAIENSEHASLVQKASKYAMEYNSELIRRIRSGSIS
jgi:outer membrane lipoprotein LolB